MRPYWPIKICYHWSGIPSHTLFPPFLVWLLQCWCPTNTMWWRISSSTKKLRQKTWRQCKIDLLREKKYNEGTLRQAPGGSHPASSSTIHPPSKKKFVTRLTEKALDLSLSSSSHSPSFEKVSPNQDSTGLPFVEGRSDQEPKPLVLYINLEPEEEA